MLHSAAHDGEVETRSHPYNGREDTPDWTLERELVADFKESGEMHVFFVKNPPLPLQVEKLLDEMKPLLALFQEIIP